MSSALRRRRLGLSTIPPSSTAQGLSLASSATKLIEFTMDLSGHVILHIRLDLKLFMVGDERIQMNHLKLFSRVGVH